MSLGPLSLLERGQVVLIRDWLSKNNMLTNVFTSESNGRYWGQLIPGTFPLPYHHEDSAQGRRVKLVKLKEDF